MAGTDASDGAHEGYFQAGDEKNGIKRLSLRDISERRFATAAEPHFSGNRRDNAEDRFDEGGFARTVGAEQAGETSLGYLQVHSGKHRAALVPDDQVFERKQRLSGHCKPFNLLTISGSSRRNKEKQQSETDKTGIGARFRNQPIKRSMGGNLPV